MSFLRLLALLGVFFLSNQLKATHIVGGEVTYRNIANDSFEITLILYIDCVNGNPAAVLGDSTAILGIFNSSNTMVQVLTSPRSLPQRVNTVNYNCVQPPSNACVDKYTYHYYTRLPHIPGGYVLAFQRCCRNNTISNIVQPQSTGATYWTAIPDTVFSSGNNNAAVFNALPPNFLCNQRAFIFDHSASDADGDSLAYSLYTPYLGASTNVPRPVAPAAPPYTNITWLPPYNVNAMMLGSPELSIDARSGLLTVNPQNTGQFVVGIQVQEFRNGQLISTTRRDFQFNVLNCVFDAVSAFSNDLTTCNDTVRFENQSTGSSDFQWDFGDPNTTADISTDKNPVYVYPGPAAQGFYLVKLVVGNGNCYDTASAKITLLRDTARFAGPDSALCPGNAVKLGTTGDGFTYEWKPALYLDNPLLPQPTSKPLQNIEYIVTRTNSWCSNTDSVKLHLIVPNPYFKITALPGCRDVKLHIDSVATFGTKNWFLNNEPILFEDLLNANLAFDSTYTLKLVIDSSGCPAQFSDSVRVQFADTLDFIPNVFTPNNDGLNDCYSISNIVLSSDCNHLIIYNRWGLPVFDSDKDGSCWDGTWKGDKLPEGTFFYILNSHNKVFHGTIALIRE
jgi:gliding motility-associated-like protein